MYIVFTNQFLRDIRRTVRHNRNLVAHRLSSSLRQVLSCLFNKSFDHRPIRMVIGL